MIYFDNAATTWPKPEAVYQAVDRCMREFGANPGRSGHSMALAAGRVILEARELVAKLFNASDASRVVFTLNATEAINLGLKGILKPGDHVITSSMEHNSVVRPLEVLRRAGVEVTKLPTSQENGISVEALQRAIRPNTKLIVLSHASNVTGTVNPIGAAGKIAHENKVLFMVDSAQTAGTFSIDMDAMHIDLLAFAGHKGLLGVQGVGGLCIREGLRLSPLKEGGTGSNSESLLQPEVCPDRYESGTLNTPGIAGLAAGIQFILREGINTIREKEDMLTGQLLAGLQKIPGITVYGPGLGQQRAAVVSFNVGDLESSEISFALDHAFGIASRPGLHCAPDTHRLLGTLQQGTVRLSPGYFNTAEEVEFCIQAIKSIAEEIV